MKHGRQLSQQGFLTKISHTPLPAQRFQVYNQTFKKKYQVYEDSTAELGIMNVSKNLIKHKRGELKTSLDKNERNIRLKKSTSKGSEERLSKIKLSSRKSYQVFATEHSQPRQQQNQLRRMEKIYDLFQLGKDEKQTKIESIYERYESYRQLYEQWQRRGEIQQGDVIVRKIFMNQLKMIENMLKSTLEHLAEQINVYEQAILEVSTKNIELSSRLNVYESIDEYVVGLKERIMDQYQKNQWASLILCKIAIKGLNLQEFTRQTEQFKGWVSWKMKGSNQEYFENEFLQNGRNGGKIGERLENIQKHEERYTSERALLSKKVQVNYKKSVS